MHIRTLLGRDPKSKQFKKKGYPRIPDTAQLHSKATEVTLPHLTSPSYRRREHIEYILHKMQRRVSHVSEPPLQGRWPCHRQDVACTSDHATQGPQSSCMRKLEHHTVLQQRTGHFQDPRGLSHQYVNTPQLNCGSQTSGLQRWANLTNSAA